MHLEKDNGCVVVIPTFNRKLITLQTVHRLFRPNCAPVDVFICDSGSSDGTQESCATIGRVRVLDVGADCWWTGAVDAGVRLAVREGYESIIVLNDDLEWDIDLIGQLLQHVDDAENILVVPLQIENSGRLFRGSRIGRWGVNVVCRNRTPDTMLIDFSNGCCICGNTRTFVKVGYFNPTHCPHLGGDQEFFLRARNVGVQTVSLSSVVVHQMPATQLRNRYRLSTLLKAPDSPYRWSTYKSVGIARHRGIAAFIFGGFLSHFRFAAGLLKASFIAGMINRKW